MRRFAPVRHIPTNATEIKREGVEGVVYQYTDGRGKLAAIAYAGKAQRPSYHYAYANTAQLEKRANDFLDGLAASQEFKAKRQAEKQTKRAAGHGLQNGDILVCSWGYEQTNVDFYQVVDASSAKSLMLCEIASADAAPTESEKALGDRGRCVAVKDSFTGKPFRSMFSGDEYFKVSSHSRASKWDGRPKYWSNYA